MFWCSDIIVLGLQAQLLQKADKDNITLLPNAAVDRAALDPNRLHYQVVS